MAPCARVCLSLIVSPLSAAGHQRPSDHSARAANRRRAVAAHPTSVIRCVCVCVCLYVCAANGMSIQAGSIRGVIFSPPPSYTSIDERLLDGAQADRSHTRSASAYSLLLCRLLSVHWLSTWVKVFALIVSSMSHPPLCSLAS